jgi:hypothetical protein
MSPCSKRPKFDKTVTASKITATVADGMFQVAQVVRFLLDLGLRFRNPDLLGHD